MTEDEDDKELMVRLHRLPMAGYVVAWVDGPNGRAPKALFACATFDEAVMFIRKWMDEDDPANVLYDKEGEVKEEETPLSSTGGSITTGDPNTWEQFPDESHGVPAAETPKDYSYDVTGISATESVPAAPSEPPQPSTSTSSSYPEGNLSVHTPDDGATGSASGSGSSDWKRAAFDEDIPAGEAAQTYGDKPNAADDELVSTAKDDDYERDIIAQVDTISAAWPYIGWYRVAAGRVMRGGKHVPESKACFDFETNRIIELEHDEWKAAYSANAQWESVAEANPELTKVSDK